MQDMTSSVLRPSRTDQQLKVTELPVKDNGYGVILEKVTDAQVIL
jgi:hypothetical protein